MTRTPVVGAAAPRVVWSDRPGSLAAGTVGAVVLRRLIVAVASLVATAALLAFVVSRVLIGIVGSPEATAGLAGELVQLPPVRDAIAEELVDRLMEEPVVAQLGPEVARVGVDDVLASGEAARLAEEFGSAAYEVFVVGAPRRSVDIEPTARLAVDLVVGSELGSQVDLSGVGPVDILRTEQDLDLSWTVDRLRFWSNTALAVAVLAAAVAVLASPVGAMRRLLPIGLAVAAAGLGLIGISRASGLIDLTDAPRPDLIKAIAEDLLGRLARPGVMLFGAGVAGVVAGVVARVIPRR